MTVPDRLGPDQEVPNPFDRLRALAVLELELDRFIAEQVGDARRTDMSWEDIAQAVGVSRPSAYRRWNAAIDDPRPTRPQRRDAGRLLMTDEVKKAAHWVTDQLVKRIERRQDAYPWSTATRAALERLSLTYEVTSVDARETEYRIRDRRALITCLEPGRTGSSGLHLVLRPTRDHVLSGEQRSREARLTTADLAGKDGRPTVHDVEAFLRQYLTER